VGAHLDTVLGTPGADDNASGVAGVLEVARLLALDPSELPVELAIWDLEERTRYTYRVGSRRHVAESRRQGVRYAGALVLEMIGYRTSAPGSQTIPLPVRWMKLRRTGDFLAAVGDFGSRNLLRDFLEGAGRASPELPIQNLTVPLRGWTVWATRRSDNASFWSNGFPALLLTDTADLRNPHYHRASDRADTLDYTFMSWVVDAVTETVRAMRAS
jgi:Zn-dependent M28 family amino/carboxypeptidase